jgi:hypothetical protein
MHITRYPDDSAFLLIHGGKKEEREEGRREIVDSKMCFVTFGGERLGLGGLVVGFLEPGVEEEGADGTEVLR